MTKMRRLLTLAALAAAALTLTTTPAEAQFGGLLNRAKQAVKNKAQKKLEEEKNDLKQTGKKAAANAVSNATHKAPCPWPMDPEKLGERERALATDYIDNLGTVSNEEVIELKNQILARAHEDSMILTATGVLSPNSYPQDVYAQGGREGQELMLMDMFYSDLQQHAINLVLSGSLVPGTETFEFMHLLFPVGNTSYYIKNEGDGLYFYTLDGDKIFVDEDEIPYVNNLYNKFFNAATLFKGVDRDMAVTAEYCYLIVNDALKNNTPDNIAYQPYPRSGSLNSLAGQALAVIKKSDSYKGATAVVIDADNWTIERSASGEPIRRKCGGWVIMNEKWGKKAYRVMFAEEYDGNSYGPLRLYGAGLGSHYVK